MVKRWGEAENALNTNTIPALLWLCQSYKVDPRQLAQVFVNQGGQPQPGQQPQQQFQQPQQQRQQPQPQNVAQIVQQVLLEEAYDTACWAHPQIRPCLSNSRPRLPHPPRLQP
jgi:hypothetical protein